MNEIHVSQVQGEGQRVSWVEKIPGEDTVFGALHYPTGSVFRGHLAPELRGILRTAVMHEFSLNELHCCKSVPCPEQDLQDRSGKYSNHSQKLPANGVN